MSSISQPLAASMLILGFGSERRGDDGAGRFALATARYARTAACGRCDFAAAADRHAAEEARHA